MAIGTIGALATCRYDCARAQSDLQAGVASPSVITTDAPGGVACCCDLGVFHCDLDLAARACMTGRNGMGAVPQGCSGARRIDCRGGSGSTRRRSGNIDRDVSAAFMSRRYALPISAVYSRINVDAFNINIDAAGRCAGLLTVDRASCGRVVAIGVVSHGRGSEDPCCQQETGYPAVPLRQAWKARRRPSF